MLAAIKWPFTTFKEDDSGAVTVDFVVLTAAILLLGMLVVNAFDDETVELANEISEVVRSQETNPG